MSNVEFDEGYTSSSRGFSRGSNSGYSGPSSEGSGMEKWLMKIGVASGPGAAKAVLIAVMVICFGLAAYLAF